MSESKNESSDELGLIRIDRLVPGGRGMGRAADGRATFVRGAVPGDVVEATQFQSKKSLVEVEEARIVEPAPERREPSCTVAASCGGCDLMVLPEEKQKELKLDLLSQALERTGRFTKEDLGPVLFHDSPESLGYRSRVRLKVSEGRLGFAEARSHRVVEPEACLVAAPLVRTLMTFLKEAITKNPGAYASVESVELRALEPEGELSRETCSAHFILERSQSGVPEALRVALKELSPSLSVRVGRTAVAEQTFSVTEQVQLHVQPGGFTQANPRINELLIKRVREEAAAVKARTFFDSYCGSGNFSLPLSADGLSGVGVEVDRGAIDSARRGHDALLKNVSTAGRVEFHGGDAARYLRGIYRDGRRFDLGVVDPPRAGAKALLPVLLKLAPQVLLMVSCDPVTLARDLRTLCDGGYEIGGIEAFDMFPQTHHVETLAILRRRAS